MNRAPTGRSVGRLSNKHALLRDVKTAWVEMGRCWQELQAIGDEEGHRLEAALIEPTARLDLAIRTAQQARRKMGT